MGEVWWWHSKESREYWVLAFIDLESLYTILQKDGYQTSAS